jgi:ribonuclease HI
MEQLEGALVSLSQFTDMGNNVLFDNHGFVVYDRSSGKVKYLGTRQHNLYYFVNDIVNGKEIGADMNLNVKIDFGELQSFVGMVAEEKGFNYSKQLERLHLIMGHRAPSAIKDMIRNLIDGLNVSYDDIKEKDIHTCRGCNLGGMKSKIPKGDDEIGNYQPFEVISMDPVGKITPESYNKKNYALVLCDYYATKYKMVEFARTKKDLLGLFQKMMNAIENMGYKVKRIQVDADSLYMKDQKFLDYVGSKGIFVSNSVADAKEQNGFIERQIQEDLNKTRANLLHYECPLKYWPLAFQYTVWNHNRQNHKGLNNTPYKLVKGKNPDYSFAVPFYSQVYYRVPDKERQQITGKWTAKGRIGRFMGYAPGGKKNFIIKTNTGQIIERSNIIVDKNHLVMKGLPIEEEIPEPVEDQEINFEDSNENEEEILLVKLGNEEEYFNYCKKVKDNVLNSPKDYNEILKRDDRDKWEKSIENEKNNLEGSGVFEYLETIPKDIKILKSRMVYQLSEMNDGNMKYKSRLAAGGYGQIPGIDYDESFSPTIKFKTIKIILSLLMIMKWVMEIYDIVGAYLEAILKKKQYMRLPRELEGKVVLLKKALYGLHQSGHEFNIHLDHLLRFKVGLIRSAADPCLYYKRSGEEIIIVCIYVDDILVIGSSLKVIHNTRDVLENYLKELKTINDPKKYLGVYFDRVNNDFILLHQSPYIKGFSYGHFNTKQLKMPFSHRDQSNLVKRAEGQETTGELVKLFNEIGTARFAADRCHPEILPHLAILSSIATKADKESVKLMNNVFDYLKHHHEDGLLLGGTSKKIRIQLYTDASYNSDPGSMSRLGYCIFLNKESGAVINKSQRIKVVCSSSCEAELRAFHEGIKDVVWLRGLLKELGIQFDFEVDIYTDSKAVIDIIKGTENSERTRHIRMDVAALRQYYENLDSRGKSRGKWMNLIHVGSKKNTADILTKALYDAEEYEELRRRLCYGSSYSLFKQFINGL